MKKGNRQTGCLFHLYKLREDGGGNYRLTDPIYRRWIARKKV